MMVVSPLVGYVLRQRLHDVIATYVEHRRHPTPGDTIGLSTAEYHARYARGVHVRRWQPTGYATLSVTGFVIGALLVASSHHRRPEP